MNRARFSLLSTAWLAACVIPSPAMTEDAVAQPPVVSTPPPSDLDWESANAERMFVLVNEGSAISAIAVDTTHLEDLRSALKLQELVFRIGGARLPIVDKQFVKVPWGKIHIAWDHNPMTERRHAFEITIQETDATSYNPPKQVVIAGSDGPVERAVSAFTEAAFGVRLEALDDKSYKWRRLKTLAIPEKMNTIRGELKSP